MLHRLVSLLALGALALLPCACAGEIPRRATDGAAADRTVFDGQAAETPPLADGRRGDRPTLPASDGSPPSADIALVPDKGNPAAVMPPLGGSSKGSGGAAAPGGKTLNAGGTAYILIVPQSYSPATPNRLMIVYSGTEGATVMAQNLISVGGPFGLGDAIFAVIDGKATVGNGQTGVPVLDEVRKRYNIDNDRTYLLSESAGTKAGLQLGLDLRQSYFAAYWANDVNSSATPQRTAAQLGFAPWGNAGPGGQLATATTIVSGMTAAGYRLPPDAPYSGTGSTQHGAPQQFYAALSFFKGKSRNSP